MRTPPSHTLPWSTSTTVRVAIVQTGAVVVGLAAWLGANAQSDIGDQIVWLNTAIVAAVVAGAAQAWWLLEARRAVSLRRRDVVAHRSPPESRSWSTPSLPAPRRGERFTVEGSSWYHEVDCLLILGKDVVVVDQPDEREPCVLCHR